MNPQVKLWGSSPTPGASLGDSYSNLISSREVIFPITELTLQTSVLPKIEGGNKSDLPSRIDLIIGSTSKPYFKNILKELATASPNNASMICDYISTEITQINIKESTKEGKIKVLVWLSNFNSHKPFNEMTKQDILNYLNSLRKSLNNDPTQKWVGSYNGRHIILLKFFRWLYNQDEPDPARRITPPCMQGIRKLPRKEKTPYKHSDMWESREHAIFLKYCPDVRDRCYHAIANDTSARPHEILNLRIKDIKFNVSEEGTQYAEVLIPEGKTGPRSVPLIDSIPYLKELVTAHPTGSHPESWLFVSNCTNTRGFKLTYDGLAYRYDYYKSKYFPKLLNDENVHESDKAYIRNMLTKPWNLYVLRHSALTEKSQILPEHVLRDHAGWTMSSKMPAIYVHLKGESSKVLLEKRGILNSEYRQSLTLLHPKECPNCLEPNRPDSRFCTKCKMILTLDAYSKIQKEQKEKDDRLTNMEKQLTLVREQLHAITSHLNDMKSQSEIDNYASVLFKSKLIAQKPIE